MSGAKRRPSHAQAVSGALASAPHLTNEPLSIREDCRYRGTAQRQSAALARDYLLANGYRVVTCNYRYPRGEIDLIAWDGDVLCFVEVRARASCEHGTPLETITPRKIRRVVRAARDYAQQIPPPWPQMRFDAIGVELCDPPRIELIRGAFEA